MAGDYVLEIDPGQVVYSRAGRDIGKLFVIVGIIDENHVLIVDGDYRKVEQPKKKKLKHIVLTKHFVIWLADRMKSGQKITNTQVRRELEAVKKNLTMK